MRESLFGSLKSERNDIHVAKVRLFSMLVVAENKDL